MSNTTAAGKEDFKKIMLESLGGFGAKGVKLSDFIDESFFENIDEPMV